MTSSAAQAAVNQAFDRIDALNPRLHALITPMREEAYAAADSCTDADPITVALKDNIDVAGVPTTAATPLLQDNVAKVDAPLVARLKEAGAILVGKANMHEWAFGPSGLSTQVAPSVNPWDPARLPGGSSSGSAVVVAAGMSRGAIGSDTGGSIRIPSAFNGISGLRPTWGLVSTRGSLPVSHGFDTLGPMAHRVEDVARLLDMIAGFDPQDPWSREAPRSEPGAWRSLSVKGLRVGVPGGWFRDGLHPDMAEAFEQALAVFGRLSIETVAIDLDGAEMAPAMVARLVLTDAYALHRERLARERAAFGADLLLRLDIGAGTTGADYADALQWLERWRHQLRGVFGQVDLIVTPTTPGPAPLIVQCGSAPELMRTIARNTYAWSAWNGPSMSVPCGFCREGMPLGMQVSGRPFDEATLFALGHAYQQATDHHMRRPRDMDANRLAKSGFGG